jgi:hypothetical protein
MDSHPKPSRSARLPTSMVPTSASAPTNVLTEVENAHRGLIDAVRMGRMPEVHGDVHRLML